MAGSFKTPCPSCEADVLVKSPSLIGKKIDCPKCKYRFTVPGDEGDAGGDFEVVETSRKKGNPKALVGIALGVVGLAVLGIGSYVIFGGDSDEPKPIAKNTTPYQPKPVEPTGEPKNDPSTPTETAKGPEEKPEPKKEPDVPFDPFAKSGPPVKKDSVSAPKEDLRPVDPSRIKDPSNLLPGQSEAVIRVNVERMRQTPVYSAFFDAQMSEFFRKSMTFDPGDVESMHACLVLADRDPFVVIRTKKPISLMGLIQALDLKVAANSPINQRDFFELKPTPPFITAFSRVFSAETLFSETGIPITEDDKKRWAEKPMGLHRYDSQTLMIGDLNVLGRFLSELNKNGDPPFQTEMAPAAGAAASATPTPGAPADPKNPGDPKNPAGVEGTVIGGGTQPPAEDQPKLYTALPNYLSLKPEMKLMLNRLEADPKNQPAIAYVTTLDLRMWEREFSTNDIFTLIAKQLIPHIQIMGVGVNNFNKEKLTGTVVFQYISDSDAKESVEKVIMPLLNSYKAILSLLIASKVDVTSNQPAAGGGAGGAVNPGAAGGGTTVAPAPSGGGRGIPGSGGAATPGGPDEEFALKSTINVVHNDLLAEIDIDLSFGSDRYAKLINPAVINAITQLKGRMVVLGGETTWHSLSMRYARMNGEKKGFPQGALPRTSKPERFGLPYLPDQRPSFIVELLPYLNQGGLYQALKNNDRITKLAWYDKENMKAATTWIPPLLVPYYPQSSWRAYHALAENGTVALGATNFVALAGLGRDAARYNPSLPEHAKLVGITGYEWGSKNAEITDGLSNTIYMIQTPPGHNRPWIAGGGATVMGVDDVGNPVADFVHSEPGGKRGTYILMADGSVRHIPDTIDPAIFKAMVTRAGGESLTKEQLDQAPKLPVPKGMEAELKGSTSSGGLLDTLIGGKKKESIDAAELQKLQGKWKVVFAFAEGQSIPAGQLEKLEMIITIDDKVISVTGNGLPDHKETILALDSKAKPKRITSRDNTTGEIDPAIYSLSEDGEKLIMRGYKKPKAPDDFPKELKPPSNGDMNATYFEATRIKE